MTAIVLQVEEARAEVAPWLGASILSWSVRGSDILRRATDGVVSPLDTGSFPMLPFCNRIAEGRFMFDGVEARPGAHPVASPHALHGFGWEQPWSVREERSDYAALIQVHDGDARWPWAYAAQLEITLSADSLTCIIDIENRDPQRSMPAGAGIHPYFPRDAVSKVSATTVARWANDPTGLAISPHPNDRFANDPVTVASLEGEDNFYPTRGTVSVAMAGGTLEIPLDDAAGFHLFVPPGQDFFCVEPVSHPPDALGRGDAAAMAVIAPGERRRWTFPLRWRPSAG